jgi:hypothetical protein
VTTATAHAADVMDDLDAFGLGGSVGRRAVRSATRERRPHRGHHRPAVQQMRGAGRGRHTIEVHRRAVADAGDAFTTATTALRAAWVARERTSGDALAASAARAVYTDALASYHAAGAALDAALRATQ